MDDDDSGEIIDEDGEFEAEYIFGDPFIGPASSDESSNEASGILLGNEANNSIPSAGSNLRNPSLSDSALLNFTNEQKKLIEDFSLESFGKLLLSKAGTGDLVTELNKHWRDLVPICFNAIDTPNRNLIDTDSARILFKPLEVFICNSIESDAVLGKLKELDDPAVLCGKVFKQGEPSYFCRDCGSDPTCVLCSNCFRNSKHRSHRYKMSTSGGGGYCDCGDAEAWKKHPNCDLHMPKDDAAAQQSSSLLGMHSTFVNKLPIDLTQRATQLFIYLMEYVFEILAIENSKELPANLREEKPNDDFVTVLYNDEIHSYEQVVTTLRKVLIIDDKKAFEYAGIVDKEGRSTIKRGKESECEQIKERVTTAMTGGASTALETKVMHHSLIAHQYFAEKLIVWLQKICDSSKSLKHILCQIGMDAGKSVGDHQQHCTVEKHASRFGVLEECPQYNAPVLHIGLFHGLVLETRIRHFVHEKLQANMAQPC